MDNKKLDQSEESISKILSALESSDNSSFTSDEKVALEHVRSVERLLNQSKVKEQYQLQLDMRARNLSVAVHEKLHSSKSQPFWRRHWLASSISTFATAVFALFVFSPNAIQSIRTLLSSNIDGQYTAFVLTEEDQVRLSSMTPVESDLLHVQPSAVSLPTIPAKNESSPFEEDVVNSIAQVVESRWSENSYEAVNLQNEQIDLDDTETLLQLLYDNDES